MRNRIAERIEGFGAPVGGNQMADENREQMVFDGLTGNDSAAPIAESPGLSDTVDAGGQGVFTDVSSGGDVSFDDGQEVCITDDLVEPGDRPKQHEAPRYEEHQPRPERHERREHEHHAHNGNGHHSYNGNGASKNGVSKNGSEPPTFRPGRAASANGAAAPSTNGSAPAAAAPSMGQILPRNRVAAFQNAQPYIAGSGPATMPERLTAPPGSLYGNLGQAPAPVVPVDPFAQLATTAIQAAGNVGSAAILAKQGLTPPQFMPQQTAQRPPVENQGSYAPWIIGGIVGVGALGLIAYFAFGKKSKKHDEDEEEAKPAPTKANPGRKKAKAKRAKSKGKAKASR